MMTLDSASLTSLANRFACPLVNIAFVATIEIVVWGWDVESAADAWRAWTSSAATAGAILRAVFAAWHSAAFGVRYFANSLLRLTAVPRNEQSVRSTGVPAALTAVMTPTWMPSNTSLAVP